MGQIQNPRRVSENSKKKLDIWAGPEQCFLWKLVRNLRFKERGQNQYFCMWRETHLPISILVDDCPNNVQLLSGL